MKIIRLILLVLCGILIILQFVRPPKNVSEVNPNDITTTFSVHSDVQQILRISCYDCHSNSTRYPWYAEIQPVGWWLNGHIQDAKKELNFSEFASFRVRRQYKKLEEVIEQLNTDKMPLPSYLLIHTDAKLSTDHKNRLTDWANALRDSIKEHYPADSLVIKRR